MKVVLINPPREKPETADFPPLGLGYVGAVAKSEGHEVEIIDAASWSWKQLREGVYAESPDVVGITCWTIERGQAFKAAHVAKEAAPRAKMIIGGPHASAFPQHMFLRTPVDFVVVGEGEETFRELLSAICCDLDVSHIRGIAYRNKGEFRKTPSRAFITDLDTIPFLLHEQFDYKNYRGLHDTTRRAAAVITSRGCPFRCVFCSSTFYWGRQYRRRSVQNVVDEIKILYYQHGIRALLFFDDNFVIDRKRCIAISKALYELKLDLIWAAEGSARVVDEEMLEWMKRAGCYRIDFGVESGSPKVLRNINKPFTVEDTRRAFRLCREAGIKPNAYLMIGSPGETRDTVQQTVRLMREIQPDVRGVRPGVWILPNTPLYEMSLRQGVISEEDWLTNDETFVYTAEHSRRELELLVRQFERGMALPAGDIPRFRVLLQRIAKSPLASWVSNSRWYQA